VDRLDDGVPGQERRALLEKTGKMAVTAPATALLLAATARHTMAAQYGGGSSNPWSNLPAPPIGGSQSDWQAWFDNLMKQLFGGG
jgi:hypothetical protein